MKKIFLGAAFLTLMGLAACEDKGETIISPEAEAGTLTFELYQPAPADSVYTLLEEDAANVFETLTFAKPDYGFSSVPSYGVEVSLDPQFEEVQTLKTTSATLSIDLNTQEFNSAITKLHALGTYPALTEAQQVYVRIVSTIAPSIKPSYSTTATMTVMPYEIQNVALPATYYLIGLGGQWGNDPANIGTELIPMSLVKDFDYDKATGAGEFVYTGFFKAGEGFKIIGQPGSWDKDCWGMTDGQFVYEGGGDITVPADGYYRINVNSIDNVVTLSAIDYTPLEVKWIEMVGDFDGWGGSPAIMTQKSGAEGVWIADLTLTEDSSVKFRADGDWANNWGGKTFPYGQEPSGDNIPAVAGSYRVVFNVFDNCYFFFQK